MKTTDVLDWFDSNRPQGDDLVIESGRRGAHVAYLHLSIATAPERWAVVSSSAYWADVTVDSGFALIYLQEDEPDDEVIQRLREYLDVAVAYLQQLPAPQRAGLLRVPVVKVHVNGTEVTLRMALTTFVRRLARWGGTG